MNSLQIKWFPLLSILNHRCESVSTVQRLFETVTYEHFIYLCVATTPACCCFSSLPIAFADIVWNYERTISNTNGTIRCLSLARVKQTGTFCIKLHWWWWWKNRELSFTSINLSPLYIENYASTYISKLHHNNNYTSIRFHDQPRCVNRQPQQLQHGSSIADKSIVTTKSTLLRQAKSFRSESC